MTADTLWAAAERLREVAGKATRGPWRYDPTKVNARDGEESVFAGPRGWRATTIASTGPGDDPQSMADATYIATMAPPVALALAEVLSVAAELGARADTWLTPGLVAVAQRVLGEAE